MTYILGISAFYHDSAATLLRDGEIVAAAQEERFTRPSTTHDFLDMRLRIVFARPASARANLHAVAFYERPLVKFDRLLETAVAFAPRGFALFEEAMPVWAQLKLHLPARLRAELAGLFRRDPFRRSPRVARRERVLSVAVRERRDSDAGCGR